MAYNIFRNLPASMHPLFDRKMHKHYNGVSQISSDLKNGKPYLTKGKFMPLIILSLSGGKDSTFMVLQMLEQGLPIDIIIFMDTGWEYPGMYDHIQKLKQHVKDVLGDKIFFVHLKSKKNFADQLKKYRWPSAQRRWCTSEKIAVIKRFYRKYIFNEGYEVIEVVGYAADEPERIERNEANKNVKGLRSWFPMRASEWNAVEDEALEFCRDRGFDWSGLYDHFSRVSCYCCPLKTKQDTKILRQAYPDLWAKMLDMEASIPVTDNYVTFRGNLSLRQLDAQMERGESGNLFDFQYIKNNKKKRITKKKALAPRSTQLSLFAA